MTLNSLASIDRDLAERLEKDEDFRRQYLRFWAANEVASELRNLRKKRKLLQSDLADAANTGQSAISRIEKAGYDGWTFKTLVNIAEALRSRLRITLEPLEDVIGNYRHSADAAERECEIEIVASDDTAADVENAAQETSAGEWEPLVEGSADALWLTSEATADNQIH